MIALAMLAVPLQISVLLHGNGKIPARPTSYNSCSVDSSREIFSARLVSGYTIPGLSVTRGLIAPIRDLLAPSSLLHRNDTTESQFSLPLVEVFLCPNSPAIPHIWNTLKLFFNSTTFLDKQLAHLSRQICDNYMIWL